MKAGLRAGQILIDTTTGDPEQTRALGDRLARLGVDYLESPIAASSEQTRQGNAMAIVAGPANAFDACRDLFAAIAGKTIHVGTEWGGAAKVKLVNNLVLGLNRVALAEGLVFARAIGLDPGKTLDVLKEGNSYSGVMDTKGRKMVEGDFSLQAKLSQHAKDVRIILEEAARGGVSLPLSELHLRLLDEGIAAGLGEQDNSAIIRAIEAARPRTRGNESAACCRLPAIRGYWNRANRLLESSYLIAMPHPSRRTFFKSAVAGAAAVGWTASARAATTPPTRKSALA